MGQPTELEASDSHADVKCNAGNDGSVTVTFSGGTSPYEVNFNGGGFEAKASPASYSNLTAGTYTWVVKDANGCIIEGSENVGQPTELEASDNHTDVKCNAGNDGSVTVTFSGGTSPYEVNFNGGGFEAKASPASYSNLTAGTYTWVVKDANGCIIEGSEIVGQPTELEASDNHTDVKCNAGNDGSVTVTFSGGTSPYEVNFNGGGFEAKASPASYSNLTAGTYTWVVKDANGCIIEGSESVGQPTALQASDSHADVKCNAGNDGSVTVIFSGGTSPYEVNFNGGGFEAKASPASYSNLTAGTYTWVVKDANGCIIEGSEIVGQPTELEASDNHTDVKCNAGNDGSVTVTFSGGTSPYEVNFNGGGFEAKASPASYSNLTAGTYTWVVKDANGCIIEGSESVGQPTALQINLEAKPETCDGTKTGSIVAIFSGGLGTYMLSIDGGNYFTANSPYEFTGLGAGGHLISIKDNNDCKDSAEITIELIPCETTHCSYTQGFYGNVNGNACLPNGTLSKAQAIMAAAVDAQPGDYFDFGSYANGNYFRLKLSDIIGKPIASDNNIFRMLPGGGTPRKLVGWATYDVPSTWQTDSDPLNYAKGKRGSINNNLLSQTMTLFFNISMDSSLGNVKLKSDFKTVAEVGCGTDDVDPNDPGQVFSISNNVINYWGAGATPTVKDLFKLANDVLGGVVTTVSASEVNGAVDAINRGFDECRIEVPVLYSPLTITEEISIEEEPALFSSYPVPFEKEINIVYDFDSKSDVNIQMYDSRGTLLLNEVDRNVYKGKEYKIQPEFSVGRGKLYFVRIVTDKGVQIKKVLSQNDN
ncbi:hypothetical protein [Flavobacterium sp.]|uniref:hypothetical protein n=1 Tax=Flavobacterium sp. TaxID=239 RepID=UPI003D0D0CD2